MFEFPKLKDCVEAEVESLLSPERKVLQLAERAEKGETGSDFKDPETPKMKTRALSERHVTFSDVALPVARNVLRKTPRRSKRLSDRLEDNDDKNKVIF